MLDADSRYIIRVMFKNKVLASDGQVFENLFTTVMVKNNIEDIMFRFWYRFVPENTSLIARGAAELVYKRIEPQLSVYMGKVFEEICKQYL